jgi:FxLD family lantipeptide
MSTVQLLERGADTAVGSPEAAGVEAQDWDLDITVIEGGVNADHLIRLTDDGCTTTCQSACPASCPA